MKQFQYIEKPDLANDLVRLLAACFLPIAVTGMIFDTIPIVV